MVSDVVNRTGTFDPLAVPDERGRFGKFGGKYAPETLMPALDELNRRLARCPQRRLLPRRDR